MKSIIGYVLNANTMGNTSAIGTANGWGDNIVGFPASFHNALGLIVQHKISDVEFSQVLIWPQHCCYRHYNPEGYWGDWSE